MTRWVLRTRTSCPPPAKASEDRQAVNQKLVLGCDADKVARLEKENKELHAELDERKLIDLDTQGKCSTAAKRFFTEGWGRPDKDTILLDYSNHYNTELGKCFVLVEWHYNDTNGYGAWFNHIQLNDVFENNKYAELSERHSVNQDSHNLEETVRKARELSVFILTAWRTTASLGRIFLSGHPGRRTAAPLAKS